MNFKINWKLRLKNKVTVLALVASIFLMAHQFGFEIPQNYQQGVTTFIQILVILGIVTDPTTAGVGDSEQALNYDKPK